MDLLQQLEVEVAVKVVRALSTIKRAHKRGEEERQSQSRGGILSGQLCRPKPAGQV